MGMHKNAYWCLVRKSEGERSFCISRLLMCGDAKICVKDKGWEDVDWMHLADDRNAMRNFRVQYMEGNFMSR